MPTATATAARLLALLILCLMCHKPSHALVWTQAFSAEMSNSTFYGYKLCNAPPSNSVVIDAIDTYGVLDMRSSDGLHLVKSSIRLNVIFCNTSSPDGTISLVSAGLSEVIQWMYICDNTLNLTIIMQSSVTAGLQNRLQPCAYNLQHAGLTTQQVTAWILITYTADWDPVWLNRTLSSPGDGNTTAFVMLSSSTDPMSNATWFRVQANSELLGASMAPSQRALAVLTSISTAPDHQWWLLICSVINATENLLVTISDNNETIELHMDSSSLVRPTLVLGAPRNSSNATVTAPTIESSTGGYWGPALQRLLMEQPFGGFTYCNGSDADRYILVKAVDEFSIGRDSGTGSTVVRGTVDIYVTPCLSNSSLTVSDAYLKVFLQRQANWTEVCAESANPTVMVNMPNRTAFQFRPCPALDNVTSADSAAKLAWCILALNSSGLVLQWTNRDTNSLVEPSAASVSFRILGDASGAVLQWGNVQVNGLSTGDNAERLVQVFESVNVSYWPVVCQLLNPSTGSFMSIEIQSGQNSSRKFTLYANCSVENALSNTPPPAPTTTTTTPTTTTTTPTTTTTTPTTTTTTPTTTTTTPTTTTTTPTTTTTTPTTTTTTPTTTTTLAESTSVSTSTAVAGPTTISEVAQKNKQEVVDAEDRLQVGTQIAVVIFAVGTLVVLSTFGICKLVAPRAI